jgi:hypothetical protein
MKSTTCGTGPQSLGTQPISNSLIFQLPMIVGRPERKSRRVRPPSRLGQFRLHCRRGIGRFVRSTTENSLIVMQHPAIAVALRSVGGGSTGQGRACHIPPEQMPLPLRR